MEYSYLKVLNNYGRCDTKYVLDNKMGTAYKAVYIEKKLKMALLLAMLRS